MSAYEGYKALALECETATDCNNLIKTIADDERISARQYEMLRYLAIKTTYENSL